MKLLIFGATGRTGASAAEYALAAGHQVTAFVRSKARVQLSNPALALFEGDIYDQASVTATMEGGFDAIINTVGADPFKPSTVVTDSARSVLAGMKHTGLTRYLGITGIAEMPKRGPAGVLVGAVIRRSPIKHAVKDHDQAFQLVTSSGLNWTLAACPYIRDGQHRGRYVMAPAFPGGFKIISPQDVADFLVKEAQAGWFPRQAVGIWY